jgi:hypothetical protein
VTAKGKARRHKVTSPAAAKKAIAKVQAHGTKKEKAAVHRKVREKYPHVAKASTKQPTKTGTGRRVGQPNGARNKRAKAK